LAIAQFSSAYYELLLYHEDYNGLPATNKTWFNSPTGRFPEVEHNLLTGVNIAESVYVRGSSVIIRFRFFNPGDIPAVGEFRYENPQYDPAYGQAIDLTGSGLIQNIVVQPFGSTDVTVTLNGLPNTVSHGYLRGFVSVAGDGPPYGEGGNGNRQYLYLTDSTPKGVMSVPWIEVLAPACEWSYGLTGPTSCSYANTFGIFYWQKFAYPDDSDNYWVDDTDDCFLLRDFLSTSSWVDGNCVDVAAYLQLTNLSLGVQCHIQFHQAAVVEGANGFVTNPICKIGSDPTVPGNYRMVDWGFHSTVLSSGLVYDACLALPVDLSGNGYQNPPASWQLAPYWQTPFTGGFRGLVRRYRATMGDVDPLKPPQAVARMTLGYSLAGVK
jgi:hypothetical protein